MASAGTLQTYLDNAITHVAAGEYDDALQDIAAGRLALCGLPNTEIASWSDRFDGAEKAVRTLRGESSSGRPRSILLDRSR